MHDHCNHSMLWMTNSKVKNKQADLKNRVAEPEALMMLLYMCGLPTRQLKLEVEEKSIQFYEMTKWYWSLSWSEYNLIWTMLRPDKEYAYI